MTSSNNRSSDFVIYHLPWLDWLNICYLCTYVQKNQNFKKSLTLRDTHKELQAPSLVNTYSVSSNHDAESKKPNYFGDILC